MFFRDLQIGDKFIMDYPMFKHCGRDIYTKSIRNEAFHDGIVFYFQEETLVIKLNS